MRCAFCLLAMVSLMGATGAAELPDWTAKIRPDHPRLFFNADTFEQVKTRALGPEREWFGKTTAWADGLVKAMQAEEPALKDYGVDSARAAFAFLVTGEDKYLQAARRGLDLSLRHYEKCFEDRKAVDWYSTSRVHAILAWDWLYNHLPEDERSQWMTRFVRVIKNVLDVRPRIYRENYSNYATGFYGVHNCLWFIGCTALGTSIAPDLVQEWLVWGHDENFRLLEHRRKACGDDGGGASPTLGYVFGAYPWAEQNFFYTWLSATGENIAPDWPHSAWLANYVIWNWIEAEGGPRHFGWGDSDHTTNELPTWQLYSHMANIRHLFGRCEPQAAALARYLQERLPSKSHSSTWFIYPFLLTGMDDSPEPFEPANLPHARHFENMSQIFMRSGDGPNDTYCLFTCGGLLGQHKHYDNLNFVIYHKGFLAPDSGTRVNEVENGQHLKNYYAQTVAHNCVLIHQPGEPPAPYWGEGPAVAQNHGGQHSALKSVVKAFETNDRFVYVAGDATESYRHGAPGGLPQKAELVTRQFVFLMPNQFVVFDRVRSTDPGFAKQWLLHTAHEPALEGTILRADHQQGRMFCRTLLPKDARLDLVGGPGREFWAAGRNGEIDARGLNPEHLAMMGQWRLEVSPGEPRAEDLFLHVIQVGDQTLQAMSATELLESDGTVGARVKSDEGTWEVTFATTGDLAGHIRFAGENASVDQPLAQTVTPQSGIMAGP